MAAIDALDFMPKVDARERARKEIGRIGVITPFFTLPSFSQRLRGIAAALVSSPYDLTIYPVDSTARLESYYTVLPYSKQVDGLIIVSLPIDSLALKRLQQSEIPILFVENHIPNFSSLEIDNAEGGRMAAEHFIQKGHSRCAYVGDSVTPEYTLSPEDIRLEGYRKTLMENGLVLPEEYIKLPVFPPRDPDKQVHELLDLPNPPTAIFAATDDLALRVLKIAQKREVSIPDELAIIGFDDIDIAEYLELTTISQSLFESGKLAAEHLMAQMANPTRLVENIFTQLKLIERSTT
ncbi:LacI family transcriptional regulator [Pelolinea submarina]|nr:LacI family transcriptional regulator [Pelolinea submarina]